MSPDPSTSNTKVCPTCGTRISENATRCLVCGRTFTPTAVSSGNKAVQGQRLPEITLSLPIALGLMVIVLAIGATIVYVALKSTGKVTAPTPTVTVTSTPTITLTTTPTLTSSPYPTATPLPPIEYTVKSGDFCSSIAASFNVSIQSIATANSLPNDCGTLYIGQKLKVPQPTPTASPLPTSTLSEGEATEEACDKLNYEVQANDTLGGISRNYDIPMDTIKEYNGLTSDTVYSGQTLILPLCKRRPTAGPTPTATLPPPYAAPNLLLPSDGAVFEAANDTITLQWAAVANLRTNEAYAVTIEDITEGKGRKNTEYVTDTKYIVPSSFRPASNTPHIIRWSVMPVRQMGTTNDGQPIWQSAGSTSTSRVFSWWGATVSTPTTPAE